MAIAFDVAHPVALTGILSVDLLGQTAPFTPPANSLIVAFLIGENGNNDSGALVGSISDSVGSTWTVLKRENLANGGGAAEIWCCDAGGAPAARTVAASMTSNSSGAMLSVQCLTGAAGRASQPGASAVAYSSAYGVSITTTTVGSVPVFCIARSSTAVTLTAAGSNTLLDIFSDSYNGGTTGCGYYAATTTPGATTVGFSNAASTGNAVAAVEILSASGGVGATVKASAVLGIATVRPVSIVVSAAPHMPAMVMEMAFTTPFASPLTWTDVSSYVMLDQGITWSRGRSDPLTLCQPGTSSWTFENSDGRFIPNRVTSPYYPNVKINRGVRLTAIWNGVTYRMFTQFTDPWQTNMEGGFRPMSPMTATDRFKLLARKKMSSFYVEECSVDTPNAIYILGEEDASESVSMSSLDTLVVPGFNQAIYPREFGSEFFYGGDGPFADGTTALELGSNTTTQLGCAIPYIPAFTNVPFTIEFWAKINLTDDDGTANGGYLWSMQGPTSGIRGMFLYCNLTGGTLQMGIARPNQPAGQYFDPDLTTWAGVTTSASYRDAHWHHYVITVEDLDTQDYQANLYIDSVLRGKVGTVNSIPFYSTDIGLFQSFGMNMAGGALRYPISCSLAGLAFYAGIKVGTDRIQAHYLTGKYGGSGETSGARIKRLLDYSKTPVVARTYTHSFPENLDTGISVMNMQDTKGVMAMDAISTAVQSEQGMLWIQGDGTVRFKDRDSFWNPALDFTLTASQVSSDFSIVMDDTLLINTCTATRRWSTPFVARNYSSQDEYGVYDDSIPDVPVSDQLLVDFARYRVSKYATPAPRTYTVTVTPSVTTALMPAMLACEPGQRFTVTSLPSPLPATLDLIVQSIEHSVTQDRWQTKIVGAPTDLAKYSIWDNAATTWDGTVWGW